MASALPRYKNSTVRNPQKASARTLDYMDFTKMGRGLTIHNPSAQEVERLLAVAREKIDGLATVEKVMEVYAYNPESIFVVTRRLRGDGNPTGVMAQLPLNAAGHDALFDGSLDTAAPDVKYLAQQHEIPSAIYSWCMVLDSRTAGGISLLIERFSSPKNVSAPIYCRPASDEAAQFFLTVGFRAGATWNGRTHPELMEYHRRQPRAAPNADKTDVNVSVVHSFEDFQKAMAVRAATYMAEHDCPYEDEYDGNDFSCTHMIAAVGGEPAGCLRIRYFASFAKIERLAVLPRFRKQPVAAKLIQSAISLCRRKGYRHIYGHCEPQVRKLWMRYGFVPRTDTPTFMFSQRGYLEGDLVLDAANDVLDADSGAMVLNRPEGEWDTPGVLEASR